MNKEDFERIFLLVLAIFALGMMGYLVTTNEIFSAPVSTVRQSLTPVTTKPLSAGRIQTPQQPGTLVAAPSPRCPSFDETAMLGNVNFEIRENSLLVNGVVRVADIPAALGLPPANTGVAGEESPSNTNCAPSDKAISILTVDRYTNLQPETGGHKIALIYMREAEQVDSYGYKPSFVKLLIYDANGVLLTSTDLPHVQSGDPQNESEAAFYTGGGNGNTLSIVRYDEPLVYLDQGNGIDSGYDTIYSLNSRNGKITKILDTQTSDGNAGALTSPDGRYLAYNPPPDDDAPDTGVSTEGIAGISYTELDVMDFQTGKAITQAPYTLHEAFLPIGWSSDSTKILVLTVVNTSDLYSVKATKISTYDVRTNKLTTIQSVESVVDAASALCKNNTYVCADQSTWGVEEN